MPTCNKCGQRWSWRHTFLQSMSFRKKLKCQSCQEPQYLSKNAAQRIGTYAMIPFIIWFILTLFNVPFKYSVSLEITLFAILYLIMPFLYELSNEEEPMW
ncbi:hypothetical protein SFC65_24075 [Priestia filamentosa]|uniref:TIGR04104 family putative zinc finger protein n=1 Tax=Priestia filamentosa TaxID=1402861 RepID=UPI003981D61D